MQLLAGNTVSDQYLIFFSFPTIFSSFIAFIVVSVVDIRSRGKRADSNDKKIFITSKLLLKKRKEKKRREDKERCLCRDVPSRNSKRQA